MSAQVAALEAKVAELESMQQLLLRLMSTTRPLDGPLDFYGATESTRQALHQLLDEQLAAVRGPKNRHPTSRCGWVRSSRSSAATRRSCGRSSTR